MNDFIVCLLLETWHMRKCSWLCVNVKPVILFANESWGRNIGSERTRSDFASGVNAQFVGPDVWRNWILQRGNKLFQVYLVWFVIILKLISSFLAMLLKQFTSFTEKIFNKSYKLVTTVLSGSNSNYIFSESFSTILCVILDF